MSNEITTVTYELPNSVDTAVFGPVYWAAFADLASKIPCGPCRGHAEGMITFWHDLVNIHIGKPVYDQANFDKYMMQLSMLNKKKGVMGFITKLKQHNWRW